MKSLILAAGRGTRVQPLTRTLPKPMIPIVHKPVMELLVERLCEHGVKQIVVNTSYLAREIEAYFREGHRFGVEIAYSFEGFERDGTLVDRPLGSAGAMQKIQAHSGFFDDSFLVVCGDAVVDVDLTELVRQHRANGAIATIALKALPDEQLRHYGVALLDESGRVREFQEKPAPGTARSHLANTGVYVFEPSVFRWIPRDAVYDIGGQLLPALARAGAPIYGAQLPMVWHDIGRIEDYRHVVMEAMRGGLPGFTLPGREVRPGVRVGPNVRANFHRIATHGPVYVAGSASIGKDCKLIGPVVVGAGAIVEDGARIEASVVLDHTRVAGYANLRRGVAGPGFCVGADGTVLDARHTDVGWLFCDARTPARPLSHAQRGLVDEAMDALEA